MIRVHRSTGRYPYSLAAFLTGLLIFEVIAAVFAFPRPLWGDENHFYTTIQNFGQGLSLDLLRHYGEMSTPLPFLLYAAWGRLFGFELAVLRGFSVLIALVTYGAFYRLAFRFTGSALMALLASAFLALHPYMVGFSVFIFTDMLTLLFVVLFLIAVWEEKPFLLGVASAAGLLCRQHFVFIPLAAGIYYLGRYVLLKDRRAAQPVLALFLSGLPLAALFLLWGGLSPDNELRRLYLTGEVRFTPSYLTLYVAQVGIYLLPLTLLKAWTARPAWLGSGQKADPAGLLASGTGGGKMNGGSEAAWLLPAALLPALLLACLSLVFPVQAAPASAAQGIETVGFFHKAVRLVADPGAEKWIFFAACSLGWLVLLVLAGDALRRIRREEWSFVVFLVFGVFAFLVIMPFSYLGWEKYFMPVLPLLALLLLPAGRELNP